MIWAVEPLLIKRTTTEEMLKIGEQRLLEAGVVEKGEVIVIMAGRLVRAWAFEFSIDLTVVEILAPRRREFKNLTCRRVSCLTSSCPPRLLSPR